MIFNNLSVSHRFSGQWMIENMIPTAEAVARRLHVRGAACIRLLPESAVGKRDSALDGVVFPPCDSKHCCPKKKN